MRLHGKTLLITGGTSGIGLATAKLALVEGAKVAITGYDAARLAAASSELGNVVAIQTDAGSVPAQRELADRIGNEFGQLDALFCNAGVADFRPMEAWDEGSFDRSFATNVKGPYFLIRALLPLFGNPAAILLNGSVNAHLGKPMSSVYAATKAAVISLARTLSGEFSSRGLRANVLSAGPIDTPLYGKLGLADADLALMRSALVEQNLAGRFGKPEELAAAALYFLSDESRYTVGSELVVDGGMSIA